MNETGTITLDTVVINRKIRNTMNYFMLNLFQKFKILEEINQVLENHKVPKLNKDEINHLNCPVTIREIKFVSNVLI